MRGYKMAAYWHIFWNQYASLWRLVVFGWSKWGLNFLFLSLPVDIYLFACTFGCRILSDCIPIKGRKRIPYLVIATLLSLFPWVILGLQETIRNSRDQLMIFLLLQNLGSAMADVVIDAMIAEAARLEKYVFVVFLSS